MHFWLKLIDLEFIGIVNDGRTKRIFSTNLFTLTCIMNNIEVKLMKDNKVLDNRLKNGLIFFKRAIYLLSDFRKFNGRIL